MINLLNQKLKILVFSTAAIFALSAVLITIETVSSGAEIANLEKNRDSLVLEKRELESVFVRTISMGDLTEKGTEMGFVKPENLMYLSKNEPVAELR